jgi:hypothetical protein
VLYALLSSAMTACILFAIIIPNASRFGNASFSPDMSEGKESGMHDHPEEAPGAPEAEENIPPQDIPPQDIINSENSPTPEIPPSEIPPSSSSLIFIDTHTEYSLDKLWRPNVEESAGNALFLGYRIITSSDSLAETFAELFPEKSAEEILGKDVFSNDRFIIMIERRVESTAYANVIYSLKSYANGTLHLELKYDRDAAVDLPAGAVDCADFIVVGNIGIDPSELKNIVITEKGENK